VKSYKYCFISFLFLPYPAVCNEILQAQVSEKNDLFIIKLEMQINSDDDDIYELLTDFNNISLLSDAISESRHITTTATHSTVYLKSQSCILFFCKQIEQTQNVFELKDGHIKVEDIAGKSDFASAVTLWHIRAAKNGTRISFYSELKPDFWLPPFFGSWLFKKKLLEETQNMIKRMQQLAENNDD